MPKIRFDFPTVSFVFEQIFMFEQTCQVTEKLTFGKVGDSEHVLEVSFLQSKIKQVTEKESQERAKQGRPQRN